MSDNIPFFDGTSAVPYEKFADRVLDEGKHLTQFFLEKVDPSVAPLKHFRWIIEGRRGSGKSSFAEWAKVHADQHDLQCLVCPVSLEDHIIGHNVSGLYQAVLESLPRTSTRTFREIRNAVRGVGAFGGGIEIDFTKKMSGQLFLAELLDVAKKYAGKVKSIVIILDEVSQTPPETEHLALELLKQIANISKDATWEEEGLPIIGLILLPLPRWYNEDLPENLKPWRHIDPDPIILKPFTYRDTAGYLDRIIQPPWVFDESFVTALQLMSGGMPDILQCIGYGACELAIKDGDYSLKERDVIASVLQSKCVSPRIKNAFSAAGLDIVMLQNDYMLANTILAICSWPGHAPYISASRDAWLENAINEGADAGRVDQVFQQLEHLGIIIKTDGQNLRFFAEAARIKLLELLQ